MSKGAALAYRGLGLEMGGWEGLFTRKQSPLVSSIWLLNTLAALRTSLSGRMAAYPRLFTTDSQYQSPVHVQSFDCCAASCGQTPPNKRHPIGNAHAKNRAADDIEPLLSHFSDQSLSGVRICGVNTIHRLMPNSLQRFHQQQCKVLRGQYETWLLVLLAITRNIHND